MFGHSTSFPSISLSLRPFKRSKSKPPKGATIPSTTSTARDRAMTRSITRTWSKSTKAAVDRHSPPPPTILEEDAHHETDTPLLPSDNLTAEHESHQNSRQGEQEHGSESLSSFEEDSESHLDASESLLCNEMPINKDTSTLCVFPDLTTCHQAPGNMSVDCIARGPWLPSEPEIADSDPESSGDLIIKRSKAFQSMLCDAPPVILISEDHIDECRRREELDYFHLLIRDPHNIVEPSLDPSRIPHIAITPPPFEENLAEIVDGNRIPTQDKNGSCQLTTPLLNTSVGRMHTYDELQQYLQAQWYSFRRSAYRPRWFHYMVERRASERLAPSTSAIVSSLYRKLYLCSVISTSLYADSFRCRWDNPEYAQSVEKPFKWSDPIEAYASFRRDVLRPYTPEGVTVTILPRREHPFTACHLPPSAIPDIVFIIESVPTDDRSKDAQQLKPNSVPEQDDARGALLVVGRVLCRTDKDSFIDDESSDSDESEPPSTPLQRVTSTYFDALGASDDEDAESQGGWHDYSPIIKARRENQLLDPNMASNASTSKFFLSTIDEDEDDEYDSDEYGNSYGNSYEPRESFDFDDDDEDGLPDIETDEWFVEHRRQMAERQATSSAP